MAMSQTAISFLYSRDAARLSPEWISTLYLTAITVAGSIFVPIFIRKFLPCTNSVSSIQRIDAVNILLTFSCVPLTRTHPRDTSTSRFNCTVSACPLCASCTFLSATKIDCTHALSPLGSTVISSPAEMLPDDTCPWNPRKSAFGLHTLWTGITNPCSLAPSSTSTDSRYSSRVFPLYHGIRPDFSVTLSPSVAETGMISV